MITNDDIKKYFTLPYDKISHYDSSKNPFDVKNRLSSKLLVTLGDSWSWGDELSDRSNKCYGNILSERLQSDWLNLSVPGAGNHYIGELYLDFVEFIKQNNAYKNILCVIVLTETGRDFNGWFDREVDYASWLKTNIAAPIDYYKLLEFINDFAIDRLVTDRQIPNLELLVGFNFVNPSSTKKLQNALIEKTWLEVCTNQVLDDECYFVSPYIFDKFEQIFSIEWSLDREIYKQWAVTQLEKAQKRLSLLQDHRYFHQYLHPKENGHVAWAEYLYDKIKKNGSKIVE